MDIIGIKPAPGDHAMHKILRKWMQYQVNRCSHSKQSEVKIDSG